MANLSFRPRPLDVSKPIPVIHRKDVDDEEFEAISLCRGVPLMPTGMEEAEEAEKHLQEAINRSILERANEIPTPVVKVVDGYDTDTSQKPFLRPQSYIRVKERTNEEQDQLVEYDLDEEDDAFLRKLNSTKKLLTESKFEFIVDRLEKEASRIGDRIPALSSCEHLFANEKLRPQIIQITYEYWVRRRNKSTCPLLIRLLKPPEPDDPSPYKAFRTRNEDVVQKKKKSRKNDPTALVKMRQLRLELERSRTLLEQIKKRERLKKDKALLIYRVFDLQCMLLKQQPEQLLSHLTPDEEETIPEDIEPPLSPKPIVKRKQPIPKKQRVNSENLQPQPQEIYDLLFLSDEEDNGVESDEESPWGQQFAEGPDTLPQPNVGMVHLNHYNPHIPPFRGRVRVGRGGRILFDRRPIVRGNGLVHHLETDAESNPRLQSMVALYKQSDHPLTIAPTSDPEKLLKKLEALIERKRKHDAKLNS